MCQLNTIDSPVDQFCCDVIGFWTQVMYVDRLLSIRRVRDYTNPDNLTVQFTVTNRSEPFTERKMLTFVLTSSQFLKLDNKTNE